MWHKNGTVSYTREKHWYYERSMSVGPLSDTVITVNMPAVAAAEFARGNMLLEWGVSDMLATLEVTIIIIYIHLLWYINDVSLRIQKLIHNISFSTGISKLI